VPDCLASFTENQLRIILPGSFVQRPVLAEGRILAGNPELKPELGKDFDAGIMVRLPSVAVWASTPHIFTTPSMI